MNLYLLTVEDSEDTLTEARVFQSEMSMEELSRDNWWDIAEAIGLEVDKEYGDTVDIEPIIDPPVLY